MERRVLIAALIGLAVGVGIGFWIGRAALEAKWSEPMTAISADEVTRLTSLDSNPVPKAGTKILGRMPLGRARVALRQITAKDPLYVSVGSVGHGATPSETSLHIRVENRGDCDVKKFSGVAYGFRADGVSDHLNKHHENFVAFSFEQPIARNAAEQVEAPLKHTKDASIVLAHVDELECKDGKKWARN